MIKNIYICLEVVWLVKVGLFFSFKTLTYETKTLFTI